MTCSAYVKQTIRSADQAGKGSQSRNGQVGRWAGVVVSVGRTFGPGPQRALSSITHPQRRNELRARLPGNLEAPCQAASDPQADRLALTTQHGSAPAPALPGARLAAASRGLWMVGTEGGPLRALHSGAPPNHAVAATASSQDSQGQQTLPAPAARAAPSAQLFAFVPGVFGDPGDRALSSVPRQKHCPAGQDFFSGRA